MGRWVSWVILTVQKQVSSHPTQNDQITAPVICFSSAEYLSGRPCWSLRSAPSRIYTGGLRGDPARVRAAAQALGPRRTRAGGGAWPRAGRGRLQSSPAGAPQAGESCAGGVGGAARRAVLARGVGGVPRGAVPVRGGWGGRAAGQRSCGADRALGPQRSPLLSALGGVCGGWLRRQARARRQRLRPAPGRSRGRAAGRRGLGPEAGSAGAPAATTAAAAEQAPCVGPRRLGVRPRAVV